MQEAKKAQTPDPILEAAPPLDGAAQIPPPLYRRMTQMRDKRKKVEKTNTATFAC